jgi:hypothetical protein
MHLFPAFSNKYSVQRATLLTATDLRTDSGHSLNPCTYLQRIEIPTEINALNEKSTHLSYKRLGSAVNQAVATTVVPQKRQQSAPPPHLFLRVTGETDCKLA